VAGPRVAVVIPAFNEVQTIGRVVACTSLLARTIVVDDGSSDGTGDAARAGGALVVTHAANRGYDAALASGFAVAVKEDVDSVVTMDADGQHDPEALPLFIRAIEAGADVVIGVRDRRQRWAETAFAVVTRVLWGIEDPLCGMKGYRVGVYRRLGHFASYDSIGTELMLFAAKTRMRIVQVPVRTRERIGEPRFGRILSANWVILRALLKGVLTRTPS
jgi:glycosyltransferase involved in cell wall biosynthesis